MLSKGCIDFKPDRKTEKNASSQGTGSPDVYQLASENSCLERENPSEES